MDIVNWIHKKVSSLSHKVSCTDLKRKSVKNKLLAAFFGNVNSKEHSAFLEASQSIAIEEYQFVYLDDDECIKSHNIINDIGFAVFRQFDNNPVFYSGKWDTMSIVNFL